MFFKRYLNILILIISLAVLVMPHNAAAVDWFPIVPCGLNTPPPNATRMDILPDGTQVPHDYTQPCNQCLLVELGKNVIDLTFFGIVPVLGTFFFLLAGFYILLGGKDGQPGMVNKGKSLLWDTAIGITIILTSWLITNFILKSLAGSDTIGTKQTPWYQIDCQVGTLENIVDATVPPPPESLRYTCNSNNKCAIASNGEYSSNDCNGKCQAPIGGVLAVSTSPLPNAIQGTAYSQSLFATGGTIPNTWSISSGALPAGLSVSGNTISGTPSTIGTFTFTVKVNDSSSPKQSATRQLAIIVSQSGGGGGGGGATTCLQSGLNLCQGNTSVGCANSLCSQYATMISRQATGVATANVLKAFMEIESSCNINSVTGTSYGLMQLTPPIPQIYASRCGVSSSVVNRAWLTNPANAELSICISAQWINAVAASQCGSSIRNLYAGYNGGQNGACAPSVSCAGETSCSNEPVKRWECLYDDVAHTRCNGGTDIMAGYNQTRLGATKIQYCVANPGF